MNDLEYGTEYPNSHLDISYPADPRTVRFRPPCSRTAVASAPATRFSAIRWPSTATSTISSTGFLDEGYAFVNVNYSLVPEYQFPVPVYQLDQALAFLTITPPSISSTWTT